MRRTLAILKYLCTQTSRAFITYVCFPKRKIDSWYLVLNLRILGEGKESILKEFSVNWNVRKKNIFNHIDFFEKPIQIKQI